MRLQLDLVGFQKEELQIENRILSTKLDEMFNANPQKLSELDDQKKSQLNQSLLLLNKKEKECLDYRNKLIESNTKILNLQKMYSALEERLEMKNSNTNFGQMMQDKEYVLKSIHDSLLEEYDRLKDDIDRMLLQNSQKD